MTRDEFIEDVCSWWALKDFCDTYDCDICSDIIDDDTLDEYVDEDVRNCDDGWRGLRDYLSDIPTGYDFYQVYGRFDYVGMDDGDLDPYKDSCLEWGDDHEIWDEEEGEEDTDETVFEEECVEPDEEVEEEDFSIGALIGMCSVTLTSIQQAAEDERRESDDEFAKLLSMV